MAKKGRGDKQRPGAARGNAADAKNNGAADASAGAENSGAGGGAGAPAPSGEFAGPSASASAVTGLLTRKRPSLPLATLARVLLPPLLLLVFAWLSALAPARAREAAAAVRLPRVLAIATGHWSRVLPRHAVNRTEAWALGEAHGRLSAAVEALAETDVGAGGAGGAAPASVAARLDRLAAAESAAAAALGPGATVAAGATGSTAALLKALAAARNATAELEAQRGAASFVGRLFTLVNLAWTVGSIGVLVSIGPVAAQFVAGLVRLALLLWHRFLAYLWQPGVYALAAAVLQSSADESLSADVRAQTLFCVCGLAALVFAATARNLARYLGATAGNGEAVASAFVALLMAPAALAVRSPLMGFFSISGLFGALGFVAPFAVTGGFALGFDGEGSLERCSRAGAALLALEAALKAGLLGAGAADAATPFAAGLQVFGTLALLLAQLILASHTGWRGGSSGATQAKFAVVIAMCVAVGTLLPGMSAVANTGLVFAYLHALEWLSLQAGRASFFAGVLMLSLGLIAAAAAAHTWPEGVNGLVRAARTARVSSV